MTLDERDFVVEEEVGAFEVKGLDLPPELKALGYTEVPPHKIILLLPEQLYELGISRSKVLATINQKRLAAYLHFRKAGWIIRDGANYGVDYLLYAGAPGTVHSKFGVMIYGDGDLLAEKGLTWRSFAGIARSVYNSKKELLVVKVVQKGENVAEEGNEPAFQVDKISKIERFLPNMKDSNPLFKNSSDKSPSTPGKDSVKETPPDKELD
jgi:hypothetical protein